MNNRFLMAGAVVTLALVLLVAYLVGMWAWIFLGVVALLLLGLGIWDLVQPRHAILRNFPVLGHAR